MGRVDWYNNNRCHSRLDYVPSDEHDAAYYAQIQTPQQRRPTMKPASKPRRCTTIARLDCDKLVLLAIV